MSLARFAKGDLIDRLSEDRDRVKDTEGEFSCQATWVRSWSLGAALELKSRATPAILAARIPRIGSSVAMEAEMVRVSVLLVVAVLGNLLCAQCDLLSILKRRSCTVVLQSEPCATIIANIAFSLLLA